MIYAYDEIYLEKARTALGRMLDFAVYDLKYDITAFFDMFIASGLAKRFQRGEPSLVVGKSGIELTYEVILASGQKKLLLELQPVANRSPEYWAGWVLAYYQWQTAMEFSEIIRCVPIKEIVALYSPYHEMDIRQFSDRMDELYRAGNTETNLKRLRKQLNLSQSELSELSGVPLRTIQQYEQRQKNINKAGAESLIKLSRVLCCEVKELMEYISAKN